MAGLPALTLCGRLLGFVLLGGLPAAAWLALEPATVVDVRFVADIAGPAGRAALADAALHLAAASMATTTLTGDALIVTVTGRDADEARRLAQSASTAVLDMTLSVTNSPAGPAPPPQIVPPAIPVPNTALAEQTRLRAAVDAADTRIAALSTALTGLTRDLAAAARGVMERKPGREALDKATVALADLQLQRIQLQSRYQDGFPAMLVLDGQIRSVRALIADEARKIDAATRIVPDPGDPILVAERDRLRAEQTRILQRRTAAEADLAVLDRDIIASARTQPLPLPAPAIRTPQPAPLLIEAATTLTHAPDMRWWAVPMAAGCGLMAMWGAGLLSRRRSRADRAEMVLQRLEAMLRAEGPAAELQTGNLLASRTAAALVLGYPREAAGLPHGRLQA